MILIINKRTYLILKNGRRVRLIINSKKKGNLIPLITDEK